MNFSDFVPYLFSSAAGAIAAYVAIRSDLATLKATVEILSHSLNRAHERIDDIQRGA